MKSVWLYHINPKNRRYRYLWDVERPHTVLRSKYKVWPAGNKFRKVNPGDLICIYMKNIHPNPDGIYVIGTVTDIMRDEKEFSWHPDPVRSARTLVSPISPDVIRKFFGRGYGSPMQRLDASRQHEWLRLLGGGKVIGGVPLLKVRGRAKMAGQPPADPKVSLEHGRLGELHVLTILADRYPKKNGFDVVHVAAGNPGADHDIAVQKGDKCVRFVEVKTRVGVPGDPVIISERELACRRRNRPTHSIFVVYLGTGRSIRCVLEIDSHDNFALAPRQFWLAPATS